MASGSSYHFTEQSLKYSTGSKKGDPAGKRSPCNVLEESRVLAVSVQFLSQKLCGERHAFVINANV